MKNELGRVDLVRREAIGMVIGAPRLHMWMSLARWWRLVPLE
jgi:hypothetical protein